MLSQKKLRLNKINVQHLIHSIRTDLASSEPNDKEIPNPERDTILPNWNFEPYPPPDHSVAATTVHYKQFIRLPDEEFIEAIFLHCLKRGVDSSGKGHYLELLRNGISREEIILRIRFSREGRYKRAPLQGIPRAAMLSLIKRLPGFQKLANRLDAITDSTSNKIEITEKISNLEHQLTSLDSILKQYKEQLLLQNGIIEKLVKKTPVMDDATYKAFEDKFRGTRTDIKSRMTFYLSYISENRQITETTPLLDIGCGRGEWLELLKENNIASYGIDINTYFINECTELGLQVEKTDLFEHLQTITNDSLGAVTAFHVIEHLPFPKLLTLLSEIKRVLVPGGIMILETPNPKNIIVAAHLFYTDPTHIKPVPPAMLQFFSEKSGLKNILLRELHPDQRYIDNLTLSGSEKIIYDNLLGPQDYTLIAYG